MKKRDGAVVADVLGKVLKRRLWLPIGTRRIVFPSSRCGRNEDVRKVSVANPKHLEGEPGERKTKVQFI